MIVDLQTMNGMHGPFLRRRRKRREAKREAVRKVEEETSEMVAKIHDRQNFLVHGADVATGTHEGNPEHVAARIAAEAAATKQRSMGLLVLGGGALVVFLVTRKKKK